MNLKQLKAMFSKKEARQKELRSLIDGCEDANLIKAYESEMRTLSDEIVELRVSIGTMEAQEANAAAQAQANAAGNPLDDDNNTRAANEGNGFNPAQATAQATATQTAAAGTERSDDFFGTVEYRQAFMNFAQTGQPMPAEMRAQIRENLPVEMRADGVTVTDDVSAIIPTTVMNELITQVSKIYGQLYARVRKLNIQGGVEFPVGDLEAKFHWITETTVSERQKAGEIKNKISFKYHIGEIRIAQTILVNVTTLPVFEQELTKAILTAFAKAMDTAILNGTGSGQPTGVLNDTRVPADQKIEISGDEMLAWDTWRKKLFAKIPLAKRGGGEFVFPASTVERNLLTLKDLNNRPLYIETTNIQNGILEGSFFGRPVVYVEPDIIQDFDTAAKGDVIGLFWNPQDYAINSNMQFVIQRYNDYDTNQIVDRALVIVDGRILDTSGVYILTKGDPATAAAGRSLAAPTNDTVTGDDLPAIDDMTVDSIKEALAARGVTDLQGKTTKADLYELLKATYA